MGEKRFNTRARFAVAYTVLYAVLTVVVFSPLIVGDRSFIWGGDGLAQHIKALSYYGVWLRGIASSIASGQGLELPMFSFSLGYGADVLDTLNYYAIGDPLNVFAVFVPTEQTPVLYTALIIVRPYLAGLAFALYAWRVFRPSSHGLLAGALVYAFCGFAMFAGTKHPFFVNPLIYLPLVLYGVERVLRDRKHGVFAISIALCAVSNFYFFYMIFLFMALYIVMRLVAIHRGEGKAGARRALADFGRLFGAGVVGMLVSCVVFVPVVMYFLQGSRSEVEHVVPLLYSLDYYAMLLLNITTTSNPGGWESCTYTFMGVIFLMAAISLFGERKANTQLKIALVVMAVMLCVPFIGYALNGFSYVANRWSWAFCFAGACAVTVRWEPLMRQSRRQAAVMIAIVVAYLVVCVLGNWNTMPKAGLVLTAALWLVSAVAIVVAAQIAQKSQADQVVQEARTLQAPETAPEAQTAPMTQAAGARKGTRLASGFAIAVVCAGIALNGLSIYSQFGAGNYEGFMPNELVPTIYTSEAKTVADLGDDEFFRYSASWPFITRNAGSYAGVSSTASYWSLGNSHIEEFMYEMGIDGSDTRGYCYYDLNGQSMLYELAGVKYFTMPENDMRPYGYGDQPIAEGVCYPLAVENRRIVYVYENEMPLPFGYTYRSVVDGGLFESLAPAQRREAIMQACLLGKDATLAADGEIELATADTLRFSSSTLPHEVQTQGALAFKDDTFFADEAHGVAIIRFLSEAGREVSLQMGDVSYQVEGMPQLDIYMYFYPLGQSYSYLSQLSSAQGSYGSYTYWRWHTVGTGFSKEALERVEFDLPLAGTYTLEDIQVVSQSMENYPSYVAGLTEDVMENVDMHYVTRDSAATSHVTGTIDLGEPKILCTQIPYSDGWKVLVDGEEADLLQVNIMFAGVALDAGSHEVEFVYETPGLNAGALASLVGIVLFALMVLYERGVLRPRARTASPSAERKGER